MLKMKKYTLLILSMFLLITLLSCKKDEEITVSVRGGKLSVKYTDNGIFLTGNTKELYNGTVEI